MGESLSHKYFKVKDQRQISGINGWFDDTGEAEDLGFQKALSISKQNSESHTTQL